MWGSLPFLLPLLLAGRNLRVRWMRTALTCLGIVLGVAVILAIAITNDSTLRSIRSVFDEASGKASLVVLADTAAWRMQTTDLAETDVVLVQLGQRGIVTLDALPGRAFEGTVTEIASTAETNRGNVTYAVTLRLAPTTAPLRWGMTAFADIQVGK